MTPSEAIARATVVSKLSQEIADQRRRVGSDMNDMLWHGLSGKSTQSILGFFLHVVLTFLGISRTDSR